MSAIFKRGNAEIESNLTPLIDVTFLLIIFFVLVSQIVDIERVDMDLPRPDDPATAPAGEEARTVINLVPAPDGGIAAYRIGTRSFSPDDAGRARLADRLVELYRHNPELHITLRADRTTQYEWIDPVFSAVTEAARRVGEPGLIARVQLAVIREE